MGGSHETPFKMKGTGHYGLGNSSPAKHEKFGQPHPKNAESGKEESSHLDTAAAHNVKVEKGSGAKFKSSPAKEGEDKRSTGRKIWDKATQIGMGLKGSLYAESTSRSTNIASSFSDAYKKEKKADEKAGQS